MRVFSGIQPTGRKHLGNFIGAIRQYVEGQSRGEAIYCVVDLHATTVAYEPATLRSNLLDTAAMLLAAGLDPDRCILFRQSDVKEHAELCWLLASATSFGELSRMHQFKDKSARQKDHLVSAGLFFYPVLQAADILAYQTDEVPVGDDQRQHIELTRNIAERFNERFGETFVVPKHRIPEVGGRIMDLTMPDQKMSTTSGNEAGTVYVLDEPRAILKKLKGAVTDSGTEIVSSPDKPGITNLIEIYAVVRGIRPADVEREFAGKQYGHLKVAVGEAVVEYLAPVRERYAALRPDEAALEAVLAAGAARARAIASETMALVRDRMGIGPPRAR
jgi:tryptophanyl-tRNA synthetase